MENRILGFLSMKDYLFTILGWNNLEKLFIATFFSLSSAAVDQFIMHYMYDSPGAVRFLAFIIAVDFLSGISIAIKTKTFTSKQAPRAFVTLFGYAMLLTLSWNMAKFSPVWSFLPSTLYGGFIGVTFYSIWENAGKLGIVDKEFSSLIKNKIKKTILPKKTDTDETN